MRVHVLQHAPHEGLGSIRDWLSEHHASVTFTHFYEGNVLPEPEDYDLIIALGGPMSANDEARHSWLNAEKQFLGQAIRNNQAVIGVGLGSQLMAAAMGGEVQPTDGMEFGWFPVHSETAPEGAFHFPPSIDVFQWHQETFSLPKGAMLLASSDGCPHQAFQLGARAIGLQFHLEVTPEAAEEIISFYPHKFSAFSDRPFVQDAASLRLTSIGTFANAHALMHQILDYVTCKLD